MANEKQETVLSVQNLKVSFKTDDGLVHAVRGVSFDLHRGETLCIVGESGSGKSVTSKTIMGILPASAIIEDGHVLYEGEDLTKVAESEFHRIRGHKIGMIFQDPLSSLNPIKKVGKQITEAMLVEKDRIKVYREKLISKEQAAYNNRKVRLQSEIKRAQNLIDSSDSFYEDRITALQNELHSAEEKLLLMKKDDPLLSRQKEIVDSLSKKTKTEIAALRAEKKVKHKEKVLESKAIVKKAKADYHKDAPALKNALKARKKEAAVEARKYKAEQIELYRNKKAELASEKTKAVGEKEKALAEAVRASKTAASKVIAEEEIALKKEELNACVALYEEKEKDLERKYTANIRLTRKAAKARAIEVMREVGIPQPEVRFNQYPFEFSGGMRQRIVIAIALTANPEILICDEPTTALDVTIQAQILELINRLKKERNMSIIFITHDLGVVANMADRVAVMYAGKIVEVGAVDEIFYDPKHPYTWALLSSIPDLDSKESLEAIPGTPPYLLNPPKGDAFAARNKYALAIDFKEEPPFFKVTDTHYAATWLLDKRAPKAEPPKIVTKRIRASLERAGIQNEPED